VVPDVTFTIPPSTTTYDVTVPTNYVVNVAVPTVTLTADFGNVGYPRSTSLRVTPNKIVSYSATSSVSETGSITETATLLYPSVHQTQVALTCSATNLPNVNQTFFDGQQTITFLTPVNFVGLAAPKTVTRYATVAGGKLSQTITILPAVTFSVTPSVTGGSDATGTITWANVSAGTPGSVSANSSWVSFNSVTLTIPAGQSSYTFPIHTTHHSAAAGVNITVQVEGYTLTGRLTINP